MNCKLQSCHILKGNPIKKLTFTITGVRSCSGLEVESFDDLAVASLLSPFQKTMRIPSTLRRFDSSGDVTNPKLGVKSPKFIFIREIELRNSISQ